MEDTGTILGIVGAAVAAIGVLAKIIHELIKQQRKRSIPPPSPQIRPGNDDTGSFRLAEALRDENESDRLDRIERALSMILKNSAGHAQVESAVVQSAETVEKLGLLAELEARRSIKRDTDVMECLRRFEEELADRDLRIVRKTIRMLEGDE